MTHGTLKTTLENWARGGQTLEQLPSSLVGFQVKAAVGVAMITQALARSVADITVRVGTVLLTSTVPAVKTVEEVDFEAGSVLFEPVLQGLLEPIMQHSTPSDGSSAVRRDTEHVRCDCYVRVGCGWVTDAFREQLQLKSLLKLA